MFKNDRPIVCIQGMGFVGAAMAIAVANAQNDAGEVVYNVVGIELPNESGKEKVRCINKGIFPFENIDNELKMAHEKCVKNGNLYASTDTDWFKKADIVVSDINLDVNYRPNGEPYLDLEMYKQAIHTIGSKIGEDTLLIVETTVPPGTCEKVVKPIIQEEFQNRKMNTDEILLAHSYERVMPGKDYYNSIVNYWRVYSGINEKSAKRCADFLGHVIHTDKYPLTKLSSTIASETAKVLENSYRAVTIAFMEEWSRFAEEADFDLFEVVDAIRKRPTHSNMRQPGFGVGGYCLTKDPYFAMLSARDILNISDMEFPFCTNAVKINNRMPIVSLNKIEKLLGTLSGKRILVLGVSYRQDVGDTRYSPTEIFAREGLKRGAIMEFQDPLVEEWHEMNIKISHDIPPSDGFDAVIFTVAHKEYADINFKEWIVDNNVLIFDANKVLSMMQIKDLNNEGYRFASIGRGGDRS